MNLTWIIQINWMRVRAQLTPNKTAKRIIPLFKRESNREKRIPSIGKSSTARRKRNWRATYTSASNPNLWYSRLFTTSPCMADTMDRSKPQPGQGIPVTLRNIHIPGSGILPIWTHGLPFLGGVRMRHPDKMPKQTIKITRLGRKFRFIKKIVCQKKVDAT